MLYYALIKEQSPLWYRSTITATASRQLPYTVREYVFYVLLKIKKRDFLRFFEAAFKKRNPKCEVSDFADFSLHGISTTALKQCMFIIYLALVVA